MTLQVESAPLPDSRFSRSWNFFGFNEMQLSIPSSIPTYAEGNVFSVIAG